MSARRSGQAAIAIAAAVLAAAARFGPSPAALAAPRAAVTLRQTADPTKLTIGEQTGPPGAAVVVPVTLAAAESVKPGSIELRVTFAKATLTFSKFEPSGLALGVSATVETTIVKGPDAATSTLVATITTPPGTDPRNAFSSGVLAYVGFTIDKDAKPGTTVALKAFSTVLSADAAPRAIVPVATGDGKIIVAAPPVISCFFYMH
jgi:hypothetical protein